MSYQDPITVSGSLVTFNDPDGDGRITNLSATFSPVQDLNGYDHPWPDGGGKNKFDISQIPASGTVSGISFTNSNGTISYSGEASYGGYATLYAFKLSQTGTYHFHLDATGDGGRFLEGWTNKGADATIVCNDTETIYRVAIVSATVGASYSGTISNIQVETGSSYSGFAPYSNICPISGLTGLSVYRTGVNVWDEQYFISSSRIQSNYIPVLPNTTYNRVSPNNIFPLYYDADKTQLSTGVWGTGAFTTPANCYYLRFQVDPVYGETYNHDISINYPSTDTSYHAYQGNLYSVDWSTQAGTVYHGTVDPVAGQLTVDWIYKEFDGTEEWFVGSNYIGLNNAVDYASKDNNDTTQISNIFVGAGAYYANYNSFRVQTNKAIVVGNKKEDGTVGRWADAAAFKSFLADLYSAGTPFAVCYELATPITYQLTQQEVEALLGTNNIWADAGDVTVTYQLVRHGFEGWLIKVGTEQTEIPINFIRYSTYKVTPDQRMEWSAERNVNGVLQRETVPNMPPKIEFNTKLLTNSDVTALMSILNKSFTVASERKLPVYFYDPENNTYKTWDCYMPDIDFKIRNVDTVKNIINYEELRFAFIGY